MKSTRRPTDPMAAAEAAFKSPKMAPVAATGSAGIPNAREIVSLRIDRDVLEHFQQSGPGWQDRINNALRAIVRQASDNQPGKRPEELDATNDD